MTWINERSLEMEQAVIYCRQSKGERDDKDSISISQQHESCMEYASRLGFEVIGSFSDADMSGRYYPDNAHGRAVCEQDTFFQKWFANKATGNVNRMYRKGLADALELVSKTGCRHVIINDNTRLMRPIMNGSLQTVVLGALDGCMIHAVKDGITDTRSYMAMIMMQLQNEFESQGIITKTENSMASKAILLDSGTDVGGKVRMLGYRFIGKHHYEVDDEESGIVRSVFDMYIAGSTECAIARCISKSTGRYFRTVQVKRILSKPEYMGRMYNSKGELIDSKVFQAIIPETTWYKAQEIIRLRDNPALHSKSKAVQYITTGVARCAVCGHPMQITYNKPKEGFNMIKYLTCKYDVGGHNLNMRYRDEGNELKFDGNSISMSGNVCIYEMSIPFVVRSLMDEIAESHRDDPSIRRRVELQERMDRITATESSLADKLIDGTITDAQFDLMCRRLKDQRDEVRNELDSIEIKLKSKQSVSDLEDAVNRISTGTITEGEYRNLALKVIRYMDFDKKGMKITFINGNTLYIPYIIVNRRCHHFPAWRLETGSGSHRLILSLPEGDKVIEQTFWNGSSIDK